MTAFDSVEAAKAYKEMLAEVCATGDRLKLQLFLVWPGILFLVSLACRKLSL